MISEIVNTHHQALRYLNHRYDVFLNEEITLSGMAEGS